MVGFRRVGGRIAVVVLGAVSALVLAAGVAAAHVTVNPGQATKGGFTKLTFRVPNEKDSAQTTKLEVVIPTDKPIAFVSVKPVPGWRIVTETTKLPAPVQSDDGPVDEAVSKITWTATSSAASIKAGEFQEFDVSVGPLPDADQLVFKALQTYSDGDIVRWIEERKEGQPEPEHPAPVLKLVGPAPDAPDGNASAPSVAASATTSSSNTGPLTVGVISLVLAAAALVLAGLAWRRGSSTAS